MSAAAAFASVFNFKCISYGVLSVVMMVFSGALSAEPATHGTPFTGGSRSVHGDAPTVGELRSHASTIADILEIASERVERLAATDAEKPALIEAIRHELSLSRRWNRHLGTILDEVAEARRMLKAREREAAKEIARMTAVAEEARLELINLKKVLTDDPDEEVGSAATWSESGLAPKNQVEISDQWASNRAAVSSAPADVDGPGRDLEDVRASLSSMQDGQALAVRNVEAVRAKIIEALETLADAQGDLPIKDRAAGAGLSSEDITAWAASTATKLNHKSPLEID
ncbi:MAG: hypothetical protein ACR2RA_01695 [Geminicoccaceae bacterium]